jgi:hypothetical protein
VKHPLVILAKDCLREQGLDAGLISGSTDANVPSSFVQPDATTCFGTREI